MKKAAKYAVALVMAPDLKTARLLAHAALRGRLAACVNVLPGWDSHYWWNGKIERAGETLLIFKSTRRRMAALEKMVAAKHPYETPEFLVFQPSAGSEDYLEWIKSSVRLHGRSQGVRRKSG
ncbi:MAG TPA: divalent-cation tolerance protein CutA [Verrucomicrobiae bacterium]|nr:divalent-cation tolerance protein CutA [Verrucomicrobiae bacterium]